MSKTLRIIVLGTNHFYDSPQSLIKLYYQNTDCERYNKDISNKIIITKVIKHMTINVEIKEIRLVNALNKTNIQIKKAVSLFLKNLP